MILIALYCHLVLENSFHCAVHIFNFQFQYLLFKLMIGGKGDKTGINTQIFVQMQQGDWHVEVNLDSSILQVTVKSVCVCMYVKE